MNTNRRLVTLYPVNSLNAANVEDLRRSLNEAIQSQMNHDILLDLGQVDLVDSAAVVTLVQATKSANLQGKRLGLCNLNSQVRMVLELTQMDRFLRVFTNEAEFVGTAAKLMAA